MVESRIFDDMLTPEMIARAQEKGCTWIAIHKTDGSAHYFEDEREAVTYICEYENRDGVGGLRKEQWADYQINGHRWAEMRNWQVLQLP